VSWKEEVAGWKAWCTVSVVEWIGEGGGLVSQGGRHGFWNYLQISKRRRK
jgi:hypothetical protein